jgi:hypothetical protein
VSGDVELARAVGPYVGRLVMYDRETHLVPFAELLLVGDTLEIVRGNGPREGDRMGTATVVRFEDGVPVMDIRWDERMGA